MLSLVDVGQEAAGQQHAKLRMTNARQRFGAGKAFALEIDLGLVPDLEPIIAQCIGDADARPVFGGHGIDERPALVLVHALDRTGPAAHVFGIGITHAHKTAIGVPWIYASLS